MAFKVMHERCSECLFGATPVVNKKRRAQIMRGLIQNGVHRRAENVRHV